MMDESYSFNYGKFICFIAVLFMLMVLRDLMHINIPNIIYILFTTCSYIAFSYEESVALTIMMIPLGSGLAANYTIGLGFIVLVVKKQVYVTKRWLPFCFLLVYEFLHMVIPPFVIIDYLRWAICMLMLMQIAYNPIEIVHDVAIVGAFIAAALFMLIDIFAQTAIYSGGFDIFFSGNFRFGTINLFFDTATNVNSSLNQNTVGELAVVSIAMLCVLFYTKKIRPLLFMVLSGIFTVFGFLCMSRTFVIALGVLIIVYIILLPGNELVQKIKHILGIIAIMIVIYNVLIAFFPTTVETTLARFQEADVSSGRIEIMEQYNTFMEQSVLRMIFGIGNLNKTAKTGIHSPHNAIQELYVAWGIAGVFLMFTIIWNMWQVYKYRNYVKKNNRIGWLPALVVFVTVQSGQLFSLNEKMLYFALCFIALQIPAKEKYIE